MDILIEKYFSFLVKDFGFKGPIDYGYTREVHNDFVNKDIIIKIVHDGDYWVDIIKTNKVIPELEAGKQKVTDLDHKYCTSYSLSMLDPKRKIWNSISTKNRAIKCLEFNLKLITENPELLQGNFKKFSRWYRILKWLKGK